jgi:hypothetical protein
MEMKTENKTSEEGKKADGRSKKKRKKGKNSKPGFADASIRER